MYNKIDFFSLCIIGKGAKEWKEACLEFGLFKHKLASLVKTCFASKVVMFQQCLAYKVIIIMCYGRHIKVLVNKIPLAQTWAIANAICDALSHVVITCVIKHCCGYWSLLDALASTIKLYVKLSKERLELQIEVDVVDEMDICTKVKKLGANT